MASRGPEQDASADQGTESEDECSNSGSEESDHSMPDAVFAVAEPVGGKSGRYSKRLDWNVMYSSTSNTFAESWEQCDKFLESQQKTEVIPEVIPDNPFGKESRRIYGWQIYKKGSKVFHDWKAQG